MKRFLAICCPPLAVLLCGKPVAFLLNCLLTLCMWLPGAMHAWGIVSDCNADRRNRQLVHAARRQRRTA